MDLNIPNLLSVLRLFLGAAFVAIVIAGNLTIAAVVFLIAMLTDIVDGYIARKYKQSTQAGIVLDAVADKMVLTAAFLILTLGLGFPALIAAIAVGYHFLILTGLSVLYIKKTPVIEHNYLGKSTAILQSIIILLFLLGYYDNLFGLIISWAMIASVILSSLVYTIQGFKVLKK